MARVGVAKVQDVVDGQGLLVDANGRQLALFRVEGRYYAIDNACPHRGGPLADGDLDGTVVMCPWHAWRWDVTTGANVNNPAVSVACFPVSVEGERLLVEVPE
ncbi:MAG: Rieske 2Fe-2S domain-containing protein [Candidatus Rokubacteria bacterium]|nr:Rieske 2Fe-2S domain-containing protein [Candidatus Rokubacteria bacterium]